MRVLFISRKFPPSTGGMELFASDLYTALDQQADVKLLKWGGANIFLPIVYPYLTIRAFFYLLFHKVDVLHMQDGLLGPMGFVLSRIFRKPYVLVAHGLDVTWPNWFHHLIVPPTVRRANTVICISQAAADAVLNFGTAARKVVVIPLAVADRLHGVASREMLADLLNIPASASVITTVGRLVKRKGVAWFIVHVLPGLVASDRSLMYVVVGEGEARADIEAAIEKATMAKHVRLLGRVDDDTLAAVYSGADLFVMPNIEVPGDIEGFGLVLLEAALCELPIVAANIEGIKDAVNNGKNAVLVPTRDTAAFTKAIKQFLEDKPAARAFGAASREYTLATYRWSSIAKRYVEVYKTIS